MEIKSISFKNQEGKEILLNIQHPDKELEPFLNRLIELNYISSIDDVTRRVNSVKNIDIKDDIHIEFLTVSNDYNPESIAIILKFDLDEAEEKIEKDITDNLTITLTNGEVVPFSTIFYIVKPSYSPFVVNMEDTTYKLGQLNYKLMEKPEEDYMLTLKISKEDKLQDNEVIATSKFICIKLTIRTMFY